MAGSSQSLGWTLTGNTFDRESLMYLIDKLKTKITSSNNASKSVSASTNTNVWTSSVKYTGIILVNATLSFPTTGGSVRSVSINGTEYARAYPSGTGATIITVTKVLNLASATNISINVTHNASSSMTVTLNNVSIVQL